MTKKPYYIEYILKNHTITDYLDTKGIYPKREIGSKKSYVCPLHDDRDPSFYVYENDLYQSYYCFGCNSYGDIINLYSELENRSLKETILFFTKGLKIDESIILKDISSYIQNKYMERKVDINDLIIKISRCCYEYIEEVKFNKKEIDFIEKIYQIVDKLIFNMDKDTLLTIYDELVDKGLPNRKDMFKKNKVDKPKWKN